MPIGETSQNNRIRYRNDEVDDLITRYRASIEESEQQRILDQLQQIFYDDIPVIALYYALDCGACTTTAASTGWPNAEDPYAPLQTYGSSPLLVLTKLRRVTQEGE